MAPMLAAAQPRLPEGEWWRYEPKWDGFRAIAFIDGTDVEITSRGERSLGRYFPEVVAALSGSPLDGVVLDGEIVIMTDHGLDFDLLSLRIHPAESRVRRLATETPATFVAFDLLADAGADLRARPLDERRAGLERVVGGASSGARLTPATRDRAVAAEWFEHFEGAGLDGVVAKDGRGPYLPGERRWVKVKHQRSADCVVAGFRWHKDGVGVGSLLLGLYDGAGVLHHVGVASSFDAALRSRLLGDLEPYRAGPFGDHPWIGDTEPVPGQRLPGGVTRWNAKKDLSWEPVRIAPVAEVAYEHLQGDRFRHTARFLRWRPDRDPRSCTYAQLDTPVPVELTSVFAP